MLKLVRVPPELIAPVRCSERRPESLVPPLYLPAFEMQILEAEARREEEDGDLDWGVEAGGLSIGADEDDDFY